VPRNIEGLKRSTQLRSDGAMERAQTAIRRMQTTEAEINFRSVAAQANVSTAWLYGAKTIRDRIMKLRHPSTAHAENNVCGRRLLSQERVIATLRQRIKALEEKNRDLTEQVEIAYGKLSTQSLR